MKKKIKLMNKIAKVGIEIFEEDLFEFNDRDEEVDAIMVRSASLHETELPASLSAIARAGAGVNNIPVDKCTERGIVVFNTPGANANGVKELALCALVIAARDVVGGIKWVDNLRGETGIEKTVEARKANALGMTVLGYDPYLTAAAAWSLAPAIKQASGYEEIFRTCDYITLHVPSSPSTKGMISEKSISMMKKGVRIINLSRADLVSIGDVKVALESGKIAKYVTDFPTDETVGVRGIINIPHLGASTYESEDHCAVMAAKQLREYLLTGNIKNSVNFPSVSLQHTSRSRVTVMHKNIPNMLSQITAAFSREGVNIENLANGSKGEVAYTIIETDNVCDTHIVDAVMCISGVFAIRCF